MPDHLSKTKTGVIWSFLNQGGNQIFSLLVTFILARLLTPEEFGTIGMIAVFTGFAGIFINFGFSGALIQKFEVTQNDINTVYFINLASGLFLTGLFFFLAPLIAGFYEKPILTILTRSLSPIFVISAISGVNRALVVRNLNFKLSTIISLVGMIISSLTAIIMAYNGYGVWSILIRMLVDQLVISVLYLIYTPFIQKPVFNKKSFKSLFKVGSYIAGDTIFNYWSRNTDNLLIGKFLGDGPLGIYTKAYAVMLLPLRNISSVIGRVMFPSFSRLQDDLHQIKSIYLKATKLIAFVTFPMMAGLALLAEPFVMVAFGKNWLEMVPIISILSLLGAVQSILTLNGAIYNSLGKAYIAFRISIIMSVINIIGFIIGLKLGGLKGLVIAYSVLGLITAIPNFYIAGKQIEVSILDIMKNLSNSLICTIVMALSIFILKPILETATLLPVFNLLILSFVGGSIYISTAYIFKISELELAKNFLVKKKKLKIEK
jgi:PST family polysaccharide transporter